METMPPVVLTRGGVCAHRKKTSAAKQCIIEAQTTVSTEVHRSQVLKGAGGGGGNKWQDSIPEIPSPSPESQEKLDLTDNKAKRTAKFHSSL